MTRERGVLLGLQALVLALPLMLGGRAPGTLALASPLLLALLTATVLERWRSPGPRAPALWPLTGFVALAAAMTVPLPPPVLGLVAPATARLYAELLPGWPQRGGWSVWRSVAIEPYGVWFELCRIALGIGVFAVVVAYPWSTAREDEDPVHAVFARLLLTLLAGGVVVAAVGLYGATAETGHAPWVRDASYSGRMSGPFVNPNHFAAWLEMIVPVALAYTLAVALRIRRRLSSAAETGQGLGVRWRQAWATALIAHQRRLCVPLILLAASAIMAMAHRASGSRGGRAALLAGVAVTVTGVATRRLRRKWPWLPATLALVVVVASGALLLRVAAREVDRADVEAINESFGGRVAASAQGIGLIRDHLLLGTGLGSWLHAFRPYQAPPIDGATWDHAHNDYVELAAEVGLVGVGLAALFGLTVLAAAVRSGPPMRARRRPRWIEEPEWRSALREKWCLRWGLAGGVAAILVHSLVDFSLRLPANLLALMVLLALFVLSGRREPRGPAPQLAALALLIAVAAAPVAMSGLLAFAGATPLSPEARLQRVDAFLAEHSDIDPEQAAALVRTVIDRAPAYREAHELLATSLGPGAEGEAALRRAIALQPSAVELRDRLVSRLWARGEQAAAAAEFEESVARMPSVDAHVYLVTGEPQSDAEALRALLTGDGRVTRLTALEPELAGAMERGLERALTATAGGTERLGLLGELVSLLEARGRWEEAATLLRTEGERDANRGIDLARAARNYLRAGKEAAAEGTLAAALLRTPEDGNLYRKLAVEVYAKRGDFETAEDVLRAGERNATNMMPVYEGVTEVLAQQQQWLVSKGALAGPPPEQKDER